MPTRLTSLITSIAASLGFIERPPPQRVVPAWAVLLVHHIVPVVFAGAALYNLVIDLRSGFPYWNEYMYLTHWNLMVQVVYGHLQLLADYWPHFEAKSRYHRARLFHCIVFPYSCFVTTFFWVLVVIDDNLVRDPEPSLRAPEWYNQIVHTVILPAALLESATTPHRPKTFRVEILITMAFFCIYNVWIFSLGFIFNLWPYRLLMVATFKHLSALWLISTLALCAFLQIGRLIHIFWWRSI